MDFISIEKKLHNAIANVLQNDLYLLRNNVSERAISHKLAEYLRNKFPDYDVDCEYNKNCCDDSGLKRLYVLKNDLKNLREFKDKTFTIHDILGDDFCELSVYPDVIVHKRGSIDKDLLVIEIKKTTSNRDPNFDLLKLKSYTDLSFHNNLHYLYGAFIKFETRQNYPTEYSIEWFENGRQKDSKCH